MCLGIPGRVVEPVEGSDGWLVLVDVQGVARKVNCGMLDAPPAPGAWVLLHMGFVVEIIDEDRATTALSGLQMMGSGLADNANTSGRP
jgi:hydrogenase maturation protein HypF